jgi:hypothetical protein
MSSCEKCWVDSGGLGAGAYLDLVMERNAAGHQCTPEQQAGRDAGPCPQCNRLTIHQYTGEPMCGCKERNA